MKLPLLLHFKRESHLLVEVAQGVLLRAEPEITRLVEIDGQRIPVSDEKPLTDVEFCVVDEKRPFWKTRAQARKHRE